MNAVVAVVVLFVIDAAITEPLATHRPFQVFRIYPANEEQLQTVNELYSNATEYQLDFWKAPRGVGSAVDVMAPPDMIDTFPLLLNSSGLPYEITIADVEKLIEIREKSTDKTNEAQGGRLSAFFRRLHDTSGPTYNFHEYGSYAQMQRYLRAIERAYPKFTNVVSIGKTHEGRSIDAIIIGNPVKDNSKRAVWVDGGIHAREWAAPHTALYFINELVTKYGEDSQITHYVDTLNWIIVPCLNPDGYEHTRSSRNPNTRLWRKNRSPQLCRSDRWGRRKCCKGVDLNRNFAFHWRETGSSDDPCSEVFHGVRAFSEPESKAVRDMLMSRTWFGKIDAFITLHTYSQIWIHPYGHQRDSYPGDVNDLFQVGKSAAEALTSLYGTRYIVGSGADTLYPASGGSDDWAKETAGVKYVYLLELRPDERQWDGFILDERELVPTARETWVGVKVVADAVLQRSGQSLAVRRRTNTRLSGVDTFRFGNGTAGSCYDLRFACKKWVRNDEKLCDNVRYFMREQCAYSCGHC